MNVERLQRGQLPEMIHAFLVEHGPQTITNLANGMHREGSNLFDGLRKLQAEGRVAQDPSTKVWSAFNKPPETSSDGGDGNPPQNTSGDTTAPTVPPAPVDHIDSAIRALKESGKAQRKLARIRDVLVKAIAIIDGE